MFVGLSDPQLEAPRRGASIEIKVVIGNAKDAFSQPRLCYSLAGALMVTVSEDLVTEILFLSLKFDFFEPEVQILRERHFT